MVHLESPALGMEYCLLSFIFVEPLAIDREVGVVVTLKSAKHGETHGAMKGRELVYFAESDLGLINRRNVTVICKRWLA